MILAGGQGTRLGKLTRETAKPAVPFGGKYRIIDFALSNCANSGINKVGVVTQYQPLELNEHIGNGESWGLNGGNGGATILQPYSSADGEKWFKGTAHAIYQNIAYIDRYNPEYVLVLSGDHIYKMDYGEMLRFHIEKNAVATIAVLPVPLEEAHRFGIMNTDDRDNIVSFEEKPAHPKSNKASMGIYIFNWKTLKAYMEKDDADPNSDNDFGKNIIPAMLKAGERMVAYPFEGYWKDVGTVKSLWEANMDLISEPPALELNDPTWRIYSRNPSMPPHFVGTDAVIESSLVTEGSEVYGSVRHSVLFAGVRVAEDADVEDAVVLPGAVIGKGAVIRKAIIGENAVIGEKAVVGGTLRDGDKIDNRLTGDITLVGNDVTLRPGAYLPVGAIASESDVQEESV